VPVSNAQRSGPLPLSGAGRCSSIEHLQALVRMEHRAKGHAVAQNL
jgi:hypothetical protein